MKSSAIILCRYKQGTGAGTCTISPNIVRLLIMHILKAEDHQPCGKRKCLARRTGQPLRTDLEHKHVSVYPRGTDMSLAERWRTANRSLCSSTKKHCTSQRIPSQVTIAGRNNRVHQSHLLVPGTVDGAPGLDASVSALACTLQLASMTGN